MQTDTPSAVRLLLLDSPSADAKVAGGKGGGLSRLIRGGFPVPPGFVIPTSAYHAFVAANGLDGDTLEGDRLMIPSVLRADPPARRVTASWSRRPTTASKSRSRTAATAPAKKTPAKKPTVVVASVRK